MSQKKQLTPAKPERLEIVFYYTCPFCRRKVPVLATIQVAMAQCDACHRKFPVVPIDTRTINFIKTILDNGLAAVHPDYI